MAAVAGTFAETRYKRSERARQLLPSLFCSAEQLLQQQSESAGGRVCRKSQKESFQFYSRPPPLPHQPLSPHFLCGKMSVKQSRWPGVDSSSTTWSKVHLHKMAAFCTILKKKRILSEHRCRHHSYCAFFFYLS